MKFTVKTKQNCDFAFFTAYPLVDILSQDFFSGYFILGKPFLIDPKEYDNVIFKPKKTNPKGKF
jgi:hypothetical protein